jgi:hypothetical protein
MKTLTITDLTIKEASGLNESAHVLSREEMKRVHGGRAMSVLIDGRPGGVVDDFQLNMDIFSGNIGVRVV